MATGHHKETAANTPAQTTREAIAALMARRVDAYEDLDPAALAADYADDVIIDSPMTGRHGKEDAERNIRAFFSAFLDLTIVFEPPVIDGDRVAVFGNAEGTNMGGFMGLAPSGKSFTLPLALIYQVRDGKIVREQRIYDFTGLLVQVGVLRAKPV